MAQVSTLSVRTDKTLKDKVGKILQELGLNHSTAINMYYRLILAKNGIPFEVRIPNKITRQAIDDLDNGNNIKKFDTAEALFEDLGI